MRNLVLAAAAGMLVALPMDIASAQQSGAQALIEQARERAREADAYREALTDPDQSVRLMTFDMMVSDGDTVLRELAIDVGLASTDRVLRALAFRHAVFMHENLVFQLQPDTSGAARDGDPTAYIDRHGSQFVLNIRNRDVGTGRFSSARSDHTGIVSGFVLSFSYGVNRGELTLQDDNTLRGTIYSVRSGARGQFIATAQLR